MALGRRAFRQVDFGPGDETIVIPTTEGGAKGKIAVYGRLTGAAGSASLTVYAGHDQEVLTQQTTTTYSDSLQPSGRGVGGTDVFSGDDDEFGTQSTVTAALETYAYVEALGDAVSEVVAAQDNVFPYLSLAFRGDGDPDLSAEVYVVSY